MFVICFWCCIWWYSCLCSNGWFLSFGFVVFGFIGLLVWVGCFVGEVNLVLRGRWYFCRFLYWNVLCGIGGGGSCYLGFFFFVVNMLLIGMNFVVVYLGELIDRGKLLKFIFGGYLWFWVFFFLFIFVNLLICLFCLLCVGSGRDCICCLLIGGELIYFVDWCKVLVLVGVVYGECEWSVWVFGFFLDR